MPKAEGGLRVRLNDDAVPGQTGPGPPLSLRDISPRGAGGELFRACLADLDGRVGEAHFDVEFGYGP